MIITISKTAPHSEIKHLLSDLAKQNISVTQIEGNVYHIMGLIGDTNKIDESHLLANPIIKTVQRVNEPYKLANRLFHPENSIVKVNDIEIGGNQTVFIAGPCSVESQDQIERNAKLVKQAGAHILRGGAFKPRTSPYAFQGIGLEGILQLEEAGKANHMPVVSELMSKEYLNDFVQHVDIIQIGARNMQNFDLLKAVGQTKKPILLKRGMANTIEEWIMAAEYILMQGNPNVILCERGIRTFEKYTRNTLDLSVIPIIKEKTHLPIIIDPSHATGNYKWIESMALAAVAAGADGVMIEVHDDPCNALSDGAQSILPQRLEAIIQKSKQIATVIGKEIV